MADGATGGGAMRGRYLVQNPILHSALATSDWLLGRIVSATDSANAAPRKILFGVGGHRGDAIIATAAIAEARQAMPDAELAVVTPSWNAAIFAHHPAVADVYAFDHWRLQRDAPSVASKALRHARSFSRAVGAIRAACYDVGIDLYPFFPNMSWLMWRAEIPRRFGFSSGGGAPLYTRASDWVDDRRHMTAKQLDLLALALPGMGSPPAPAAYSLPSPREESVARARQKLAAAGVSHRYVVAHPGSGQRLKDWPSARWHRLADLVASTGFALVLTGRGADESANAAAIADAHDGVVSLADVLTWDEFSAIVAGAAAVVSGDTVTAHLAAAYRRPVVVLFTGINDMREWRPIGERVAPLIEPVACAPCMQKHGCSSMQCIGGIAPERVFQELSRMLEESDER